MGSGKTSIAKLLAQKMELPFKDTDHLIELKWGKKISEIFSQEGEEKFREYETQILKSLSAEDSIILATGGGIIEKVANHALLKNNAVIFYLKTTPDDVLKFTNHDKSRPLLQGKDPLVFITEKLNNRIPTYLHLCDYQIETHGQTLEDLTQEIVDHLKNNNHFT